MKVSLNWVRQYIDFELPPVDELVQRIGEQLGAVEEVVDFGAKYTDVLVAKVVSCEQHPNADKLHVCKIDDGGKAQDVARDENGYVQVVCGAPNVREGLLVAWLPPGATVPESYDKDPFVLGARELRGVVSNGMIASARELALGDEHDGILEIDEDAAPSASFADVYDLNDTIIDIENKMFTHRPDCFGQLGVAREIAGILGQKFTSPEWYLRPMYGDVARAVEQLPLRVVNELPNEAPRFMAVVMSGVTVKPSPIKLQTYLLRVGMKPINNVVDVTNYIMALTGQPTHAYDYDKVKALSDGEPALVVRYPRAGETIKLLNGKEIEPREEAIMIATDKQLIGIGGVMGGSETEVDENTKNIILECANFDMYSIRRTSMAHGLFTDAVTRFNKGQSAYQNDKVVFYASGLLTDLTGASAQRDFDDYGADSQQQILSGSVYPGEAVITSAATINSRLGLSLDGQQIKQLLENVEFNVTEDNSNLRISAPFWRTDIELPEDIVEEVGRLYGYDKLPLEMPNRTMRAVERDANIVMKQQLRDVLSSAGANEILSYSFVHGNLLEKVGQDKAQAFELSNALSPDLQYYRLTLMPSLLDKVHANIKAGYDEFALFEIGKVHAQSEYEGDLPTEFDRLALVYASKRNSDGAAYYCALTYLQHLLHKMHSAEQLTIKPFESAAQQTYYAQGRAAALYVGDELLGYVGEFTVGVRKALKLPEYSAGFEIDLGVLQKAISRVSVYVPLSRFPSVSQDITLRVANDLPHAELRTFMQEQLQKQIPEHERCTVTDKDIFQKQDDLAHKQVSFGITVTSYEKTLRDTEVTKLLDGLVEAAKEAFGAERI